MKYRNLAVAALAVVCLSACGGGGGGSRPAMAPPMDAQTAFESATEQAQTILEQAAQRSPDPIGSINVADDPIFGSVVQTRRTDGISPATGIATTWSPTDNRFTATVSRENGESLRVETRSDNSRILNTPGGNKVTNRPAIDGVAVQIQGNAVVVGIASIEWSNADPTDYLAGGAWIYVDANGPEAEVGAFIDGPAYEDAALTLPVTGTATYNGRAAGGYASQGGSDSTVPGAFSVGSYDGDLRLTADFGQGTINGNVSDIILRDLAGGELASRYALDLGAVSINDNGTFSGSTLRISHPDLTFVEQEGSWAGRFANVNNAAGHPRAVAGTNQGSFTTAGGSEAVFSGAFYGATERFE